MQQKIYNNKNSLPIDQLRMTSLFTTIYVVVWIGDKKKKVGQQYNSQQSGTISFAFRHGNNRNPNKFTGEEFLPDGQWFKRQLFDRLLMERTIVRKDIHSRCEENVVDVLIWKQILRNILIHKYITKLEKYVMFNHLKCIIQILNIKFQFNN